MKQKRTLSLIMGCLVATAAIAGTPRHRSLSERLNTEYRPAERMVLPQAKPNYDYKMDGFISSDEYEISNFSYNSQKQLVAVYETVVGEWQIYDSLRYNDQGQMVRLEGWQWLNNAWTNVYYVEYGYNAQGLVSSRTNYNKLNGEWQLGGVYEYTYNAEGQITLSSLTLAYGNSEFQRIEYTYSNGRLDNELWKMDDFMGSLANSEKINYYYDQNGKVVSAQDSIWDDSWNSWGYGGHETWAYDANGNCTIHSTFNASHQEATRSEYEYTSNSVNNTLIPYHFELGRPYTYTNVNTYDVEHWYQMDANHVFGYAWDYYYNYSGINGINNVEPSTLKVYPNPAANYVIVEGALDAPYSIYDCAGRLVQQGRFNAGRIDINMLPNGIYTVTSQRHAAHFVIEK